MSYQRKQLSAARANWRGGSCLSLPSRARNRVRPSSRTLATPPGRESTGKLRRERQMSTDEGLQTQEGAECVTDRPMKSGRLSFGKGPEHFMGVLESSAKPVERPARPLLPHLQPQ